MNVASLLHLLISKINRALHKYDIVDVILRSAFFDVLTNKQNYQMGYAQKLDSKIVGYSTDVQNRMVPRHIDVFITIYLSIGLGWYISFSLGPVYIQRINTHVSKTKCHIAFIGKLLNSIMRITLKQSSYFFSFKIQIY